jgi:hypothetical protein
MATRDEPLLRWQWNLYPNNHRNRATLLVHAITNPMFLAGNVALATAPFSGWWLAPAGLVGTVLAIALQGRTHKVESVPPEPFLGPADAVKRIFAEQWITWPRYLFSGGFARAWRDAK